MVAAGGGAAGTVAAGAAPVFGAVWASPIPAGKATNAIVAAIKESLDTKESNGMKTSNAARPASVILWRGVSKRTFAQHSVTLPAG